MIRPTLRLVLVFVGGLPLAVVPAVLDARLWPCWLLYALGTLVLGWVDGLRVPPPRACGARLGLPPVLYVGEPDRALLELWPAGWSRRTALDVRVELDEHLVPQATRSLALAPGTTSEVPWPLVARRRGRAVARAIWFRAWGPMGLALRTWRVDVGAAVPVVPNVRAVVAEAVRFQGERTAVSGMKTERYIGDGSEFDSLRKFTRGYDSGAIDWKASARHRTLLCKMYRAERDHDVLLAFDTGRLMSEPLEGIPRLDHAINAGLLLGYVCLKTGDRVGLFGFDSRPGAYLPPRGGIRSFARFQQRSAELEYSTEETNFTLCILELMRDLRRRSLIVVFTEFVDSTSAELLVANLENLARRHVVLFVALEDPLIHELTSAEPAGILDVSRAVIAADLARDRRAVLKRLRRAGIHCLSAQAADVSPRLLNRYLEIRRRELV